jgi:hypothetical protein
MAAPDEYKIDEAAKKLAFVMGISIIDAKLWLRVYLRMKKAGISPAELLGQ